jgi:hypothetical protein
VVIKQRFSELVLSVPAKQNGLLELSQITTMPGSQNRRLSKKHFEPCSESSPEGDYVVLRQEGKLGPSVAQFVMMAELENSLTNVAATPSNNPTFLIDVAVASSLLAFVSKSKCIRNGDIGAVSWCRLGKR